MLIIDQTTEADHGTYDNVETDFVDKVLLIDQVVIPLRLEDYQEHHEETGE